jgi:hypothetical protein
MSRYGIDYYGVSTSLYGNVTAATFVVQSFIAKSGYVIGTPTFNAFQYGSITISWVSPSGGWLNLRLVRNSYGFPVDADDGDILVNVAAGADPTLYYDTGSGIGGLQQGRTYYYSIFVQEPTLNTWVRAGNTYGISVKDFGTNDIMLNNLPNIMKSSSPYQLTSGTENTDLSMFLSLFAFEYDLEKTQAYNVLNTYDTTFVDGRLIPPLMQEFGLVYEPEIGLQQSRILLRNIMNIYKNKGSLNGLKTFIKAFTGYDASIKMGYNLFLDYNCSSFEESTGFWAANAATLISYNKNQTPTIAPYLETTEPALFANLTNAVLKVVPTANGTLTLSCGDLDPVNQGIPVSEKTSYVFSIYGQSANTRTVSLAIKWYDYKGNYLSTSSFGTGAALTSGGWLTRPSVTATSPATADFAVPIISVASAVTTDIYYFDAALFRLSTADSIYDEARNIKITLLPTRTNELVNPNFASTSSWTTTNGTQTTVTATQPNGFSGNALQVTRTSGTVTTKSTNVTTITPNFTYTFSTYLKLSGGTAGSDAVNLSVQWYNSLNTLVQTDSGPIILGTNLSTTDWARAYATGTAPTTASYAVVNIIWTGTQTAVKLLIDEALFELSSFVNPYFDGTTGSATPSSLMWEGTTNASRSFYYKNRTAIQGRLISALPKYLNTGSFFELYFSSYPQG